ncbi:hypothetical protein VZT92_008586 [Zoarces viviparus]|uniref:Uncharacterized protein n=1 Tax=Zoarces viviparus TaxID=48416 RepID=A0AAW1FFW3_ZOAVI
MPVLYHVQSIHRPCIWEIAVMMLEPTSALTFQLGSSVATIAPMMPNSARTNPNICMPVDAMLLFELMPLPPPPQRLSSPGSIHPQRQPGSSTPLPSRLSPRPQWCTSCQSNPQLLSCGSTGLEERDGNEKWN